MNRVRLRQEEKDLKPCLVQDGLSHVPLVKAKLEFVGR